MKLLALGVAAVVAVGVWLWKVGITDDFDARGMNGYDPSQYPLN